MAEKKLNAVVVNTEDLEALIRRIVEEVVEEKLKAVYEYIYELEAEMPDPDEGKPLKPEFEASLRDQLSNPGKITPADAVYRKLGLDE